MNQEKLADLLSRYLDNELDNQERVILAERLATDPAAKKCFADLQHLQILAGEPAPKPSVDLQDRLAKRVAEKYAQPSSGLMARIGKFLIIPSPALAVAMVAILAVGVWALWPNGSSFELDNLQRDVQHAQRDFHAAVVRLENAARDHMNTLPEWLAEDYSENLRLINEAIASCEKLIEEQPGNTEAYATLTLAYQAKIRLLEKIMTPIGG